MICFRIKTPVFLPFGFLRFVHVSKIYWQNICKSEPKAHLLASFSLPLNKWETVWERLFFNPCLKKCLLSVARIPKVWILLDVQKQERMTSLRSNPRRSFRPERRLYLFCSLKEEKNTSYIPAGKNVRSIPTFFPSDVRGMFKSRERIQNCVLLSG